MKLFNTKLWITLLVLLVLIDCALGSYIAIWRDGYWQAIANKELGRWIYLIVQFTILALISCFISGYSQYLINIIALYKRTQLTRIALKSKTYKEIEGGAQRVQEDCMNYPLLGAMLGIGLFRAVTMSIFYIVLISIQLNLWYLLIPIGYSFIGTGIAGRLAKPLINLNYVNQVFEARFRQLLTKLNYKDVHNNNYVLYRVTKLLQYFQSFYGQITIIVPHIILAPLYFSLKITFGMFMQIAAAMIDMINNLSYIVTSFNDINRFLSCRRRLKESKII